MRPGGSRLRRTRSDPSDGRGRPGGDRAVAGRSGRLGPAFLGEGSGGVEAARQRGATRDRLGGRTDPKTPTGRTENEGAVYSPVSIGAPMRFPHSVHEPS